MSRLLLHQLKRPLLTVCRPSVSTTFLAPPHHHHRNHRRHGFTTSHVPQGRLRSILYAIGGCENFNGGLMKREFSKLIDGQRGHVVLASSNDDRDDRDNDDDKDNSGPNVPGPKELLAITLLALLTAKLFDNMNKAEPGGVMQRKKETSFSQFLNELLPTGHVEQLTVVDFEGAQSSNIPRTVSVVLRSGVEVNGELITSPGPHYTFSVGDVKTFEERLRDAQRQLGVDPSDYIPVKYQKVDPSALLLPIMLWFIVSGVIAARFMAKRMKPGGKKAGGGNKPPSKGLGSLMDPFSSMTRAKPTIIKPGSKKQKAIRMADVAGMQEAKEEVQEFVSFLQHPERFQKLGAKMPKGALLCGPPGTGKTLLAKAVSAEAGVPFISMAGSDFVEMIGGLGAARVRDLFKQAKELTPCIIYIDEVDAVGRARNDSREGGSGEYEQTLNQLLVEMDGMGSSGEIVVLASTNRDDVLDRALTRPGRFDRTITIDLPTLPERREIFKVYLKKLKLGRREDMFEYHAKRLAELTPGKSGADIASICNEAAYHAARLDQKSVDQENFEHAIERVIAGLQSNSSTVSPQEKRTIAYHEAGHVVTSWMLKHTEPILKISTRPRTNSPFGFKQVFPLDRKLQSDEQLFDLMCSLLGGRTAEHIVFGEVTTAAQDDMEKVTNIAYQLITNFGMNKRIGPLSFPTKQERGPYSKRPYSAALAKEIDEEANRTLFDVNKVTRDILESNRDKLDIVASALLDNEVLNYDDLVKLLGDPPHGDKLSEYYAQRQILE